MGQLSCSNVAHGVVPLSRSVRPPLQLPILHRQQTVLPPAAAAVLPPVRVPAVPAAALPPVPPVPAVLPAAVPPSAVPAPVPAAASGSDRCPLSAQVPGRGLRGPTRKCEAD